MSLTIVEVYTLAKGVGLSHTSAVTATAIAMAESGLNPNAVGDVGLEDAKWGPSVGLWQIRSVKQDNGTGRPRDASKLKDPRFNARAMASISALGMTWSPWSTYNNGAYRAHVAAVTQAVGDGSAGSGVSALPPQAPQVTSTGWDIDPFPGGGGLPGYTDDALGGALGLLGGAVTGKVEKTFYEALTWTAALGLGVVLVVIGARRAVA